MKAAAPDSASVRGYVLSGLLAVMVLIAGFGVWATQTMLSGAIVAVGQGTPNLPSLVVQHVTGGTVAEVHVKSGDQVQRGAVLLRFDTAEQERARDFAQRELFTLQAQQDRLRAQYLDHDAVVFDPVLISHASTDHDLRGILDRQNDLFVAGRVTRQEDMQQTEQSVRQIEAQVAGVVAQLITMRRQRDLVSQTLVQQQSLLERKLMPAATVLETRRQFAQIETELAKLSAQKKQAIERRTETEIALRARLASEREEAMARARDLEEPMRRFQAELIALETEIGRAAVRASVSGLIDKMQVTGAGFVLRPAEPILTLVPTGARPLVTARVMPEDIDQIRTGQRVKLRLAALDHRITPEIWGKVTAISPDAIKDDRRGTSYFAVKIEVPDEEIALLPEGAVLLPGMPVEVFLQTGDRTPLSYLTKPMTDYFAHAMREN